MTPPVVRVGPAARRDLDAHVLWLRGETGPDVAVRFVDAAAETFRTLAATPGLGPVVSGVMRSDLRKWRVDRFPRVLVFYLPMQDGIRIVRVLHAAQDWSAILG